MTTTQHPATDHELDITSDVCPMTFVRVRLMLDRMLPAQTLRIRLKGQEPIENVPRSAVALGHEVLSLCSDADGVCSLVLRRGG